MAKSEVKKVSRIKSRNKIWYRILAPKIFGEKEIGESYLTKAEDALGRSLNTNLKELTDNVRDQNAYIVLRMDKVDGTAIKTSIIGYQLTSSIIRRLVRKNTDRVDDYFTAQVKSGREIVVKTLLITLRQAQKSVKTQLRKQAQEVIKEEMKKGELDLFVANLVNGNIRNLLKKRLNKVYPLREMAVRVLSYKKSAEERAGGGAEGAEGAKAAGSTEKAESLGKAEKMGRGENREETESLERAEAKEKRETMERDEIEEKAEKIEETADDTAEMIEERS